MVEWCSLIEIHRLEALSLAGKNPVNDAQEYLNHYESSVLYIQHTYISVGNILDKWG